MSLDILGNYAFAIFLFLIIFTAIVFIHEFGHYIFAKMLGVKVEEFGIGIPPRVFSLFQDRSGTVYSLNLLPIGGFVSFKGEKYNELSVYELDSLSGAKVYNQMMIVLAGVLMNFIFAGIVFSAFFYNGIKPMVIENQYKTTFQSKLFVNFDDALKSGLLKVDGLILSPAGTGSLAARSGIKDKDILLKINDKTVATPGEMVNSVKYLEAPLIFTVKRGVKTIKLKIVPDNGKIGCYVSYNVTGQDKNVIFKYDGKEALKQGFKEVFNQSMQVLETMKIIIKNIVSPGTAYERTAAINSIQGPIGLGDQFIKFVELKMDFSFYLMIAAILSVNLGVFNLLPFPALDGGRFFIMFLNMLLIAACGRKAIDEKVEIFVHIFGFGSLIGLSILVAYMDLLKIFTK